MSKGKQTLTEVFKITKLFDGDALVLGLLGYSSTKLYNAANWARKEAWKETGKILSCSRQKRELKTNRWYKSLHSQTAQAVLEELDRGYRSWYALRKEHNKARPPGFRKRDGLSTLTFKQRAFDLTEDSIRISIPRKVYGRNSLFLKYAARPGLKMGNPRTLQLVERKGEWYAHVTYEVPVKYKSMGHVMAGDLGEKYLIATVSTDGSSALYPGGELRALDRYFSKESAKCRYPWSRKNGNLKGKWSRKRRHLLHCVSKRVVTDACARGVSHIVLGYPKDVRDNMRWGRVANKRMHAWPFKTLIDMITYKAALRGIRVIIVDERGTSSKCSVCGYRDREGRKTRGRWSCPRCGVTIQADINGAANILSEYLLGEGNRVPSLWSSGCLAQPAVNRFAWGDPRPEDREAGTVKALVA